MQEKWAFICFFSSDRAEYSPGGQASCSWGSVLVVTEVTVLCCLSTSSVELGLPGWGFGRWGGPTGMCSLMFCAPQREVVQSSWQQWKTPPGERVCWLFWRGWMLAAWDFVPLVGFLEYFKLYFYNPESSYCPKRSPFPFKNSSKDLDFGTSCFVSLPQFSYLWTKNICLSGVLWGLINKCLYRLLKIESTA